VHRARMSMWIAEVVARRGVSLALAVACVVVDRVIPWQGMSFAARGLIDEPCHLATALVVLGAITRYRRSPPASKFCWSMLACSVLIDIDHLPSEFGSSVLTAGTPRPYTHALWVVAMLILATAVVRRQSKGSAAFIPVSTVPVLDGAIWGVSAHFLRDVATAQMSLWWPLTDARVEVPYWWYPGALLLIIAFPVIRPRRSVIAEEKLAENTVGVP
jgi:LexA-binding, inner membrane-associated putative hydrolase